MPDVSDDDMTKAGGEALSLLRDDDQVLTLTWRHELGWSYTFCSRKTWEGYPGTRRRLPVLAVRHRRRSAATPEGRRQVVPPETHSMGGSRWDLERRS